MLFGSRSGLAPVPVVLPETPPLCVPLVLAPPVPGVPAAVVPDLSSTGAVVGVDWQPTRKIATSAAMVSFFILPPLEELSSLPRIGTPCRLAHIRARGNQALLDAA